MTATAFAGKVILRVAAGVSVLWVVVMSGGCTRINVQTRATAAAGAGLVMTGPFDHLDARAREPMLV